jgi:hypothetical protein
LKLGKEFFTQMFETNEVSDAEKEIRGEELEQVVEDIPKVDQEVPKVEEETKTTPVEKDTEKKEETEVPQTFNIDGEEMTIEQIRELKKGNMRQSDYTKKTQELADQRKEIEKLRVELESSPEAEGKVMKEKMDKLEYELASKELETELTMLKEKYPDFDEVKVLTEANKRGMTTDLEFIYKATREVSQSTIDVEAEKQKAIDEYKKSIQAELQKNTDATSGSIITSEPGTVPTNYDEMLTSDEKEYCRRRGITNKNYVEMRDAQYKI